MPTGFSCPVTGNSSIRRFMQEFSTLRTMVVSSRFHRPNIEGLVLEQMQSERSKLVSDSP